MNELQDRPKILRITTVSLSLEKLLTGQLLFMDENGYEIHTASHGVFNHPNHNEVISLTRKLNPFIDIKGLLELISVIKEVKPQIVHTHTPKAGLLGMLAAKYCGVKVRMHTVGGLPLMEKGKILRNFLKIIERITYAASTHVYCNSFGLKDYIARKLYYSKKLKVVGNGTTNGINIKQFNPNAVGQEVVDWHKNELGIDKDDNVFLFVGRIVKDKGIIELVESFESINQNHSNTKLVLVGHFEEDLDPLPHHIQEAIAFNSQIINVGYQHDVRPYIALSDILIFPSYREGFPNVPLQAGAMRKALVLSDINGCNEIVKDKENGLLVPVKTRKELIEAMELLITDKDFAEKLAHNAMKSITERYEQSVVWEALLNEYNLALKK
ncbi:MAG: glycosyltransferase family 1 protein [Bacteroidetes bacterium]|nr:MAG: glycosyltransferase family 1 protein [Bacteroidota bacterium]